MASRAEIAGQLRRWTEGALAASELRAWAEARRWGPGVEEHDDAVVVEALGDLDLLAVHLLTPDDVPALLSLLDGGDLAAWRAHLAAIDVGARARKLRRDPLYQPFCR